MSSNCITFYLALFVWNDFKKKLEEGQVNTE